MKPLVVAATREELSVLYQHFELPNEPFVQTERFDLLITGVGMTATAFALGRYLSAGYNLVLNLGIAGTFDRKLSLGTVVNVVADVFAELGAENKDEFLTIDQLGFGQSNYKPIETANHQLISELVPVRGITVNKVHGNSSSITAVVSRLDPQIESMEGAAIFYSCAQLSLPSLQVRSISNYVEERNKDSWKIGLAIKTLNQWAINFLTNT